MLWGSRTLGPKAPTQHGAFSKCFRIVGIIQYYSCDYYGDYYHYKQLSLFRCVFRHLGRETSQRQCQVSVVLRPSSTRAACHWPRSRNSKEESDWHQASSHAFGLSSVGNSVGLIRGGTLLPSRIRTRSTRNSSIIVGRGLLKHRCFKLAILQTTKHHTPCYSCTAISQGLESSAVLTLATRCTGRVRTSLVFVQDSQRCAFLYCTLLQH